MADINDLVNEVADLTTANQSLTAAVNVRKSALEQARDAAVSAAGTAESDRIRAESAALTATTKAGQAEGYAGQLETLVTEADPAGFNPVFDILIRDPLRLAAEASSGGRVTVLYDSHGNPNWMHVLPRFRYEDLGFATEMGSGTCTAFIVGGVEKSEIFIGQFLASGNQAQSIAGADPSASITYDNALAACAAKGAGWHLMTAHEWAAVALWCMANGFEPRGNTNWGHAHDATHETAVREDGRAPGDTGGTGRTMTGGGPAGWYHSDDHSGIADLVGNVWEWVHGLKFVGGRVVCLPDNDFAAPESSWVEQNTWANNVSGSPQLANVAGTPVDSSISTTWAGLSAASGYTPSNLARRLLIEPAGIHPQGRFYINTSGERFPCRGGNRNSGSNAGLAALGADIPRSHSHGSFGFRPAFCS